MATALPKATQQIAQSLASNPGFLTPAPSSAFARALASAWNALPFALCLVPSFPSLKSQLRSSSHLSSSLVPASLQKFPPASLLHWPGALLTSGHCLGYQLPSDSSFTGTLGPVKAGHGYRLPHVLTRRAAVPVYLCGMSK